MASRRVRRLAPAPRIAPLIGQAIDRSQNYTTAAVRKLGRPGTIPMQDYATPRRTPIAGGYGSAIVAAGTATVKVGPMGVGTVWYPQAAAIATTTGANDASTCALYLGPLGLQTLIGGQSYAGGGDTIGLAVPPLWNGYFIWAVWSNAVNGDLATLTIYGEQDSLHA